jgi:uncharacterized protein YjiS (DUF1127 family)
MPCGSTTYIPTNHIETASPSRRDRAWSWQIPLSWLAKIASKIASRIASMIASKIAMGLARRHRRGELLEMDDRLLADIGISREQAIEEALKSSSAHVLMWQLYR